MAWRVGYKDDAHVILVYALDDTHRTDIEWLQRVASALREMVAGPVFYSFEDNRLTPGVLPVNGCGVKKICIWLFLLISLAN